MHHESAHMGPPRGCRRPWQAGRPWGAYRRQSPHSSMAPLPARGRERAQRCAPLPSSAMSLDFPAFELPEEHQELRAVVRQLADDKIAPRAAEIDESGEFPWDVHDALARAELTAVHIPEAYGGSGADAIATAIVIEEVARACAASSLIPAVNKLGTVPLLLAGSDALKRRYLPPVARGEAMFSYALSEPDSGSDAVAMRARAVRDGDTFVLNGTKRWITNAGVSTYYTVLAVTDPAT